MDANAEEMYLQNIEEYLLDEDKIVTYKWLSKILNIHVNLAKQLLYSFYSSRRDSICATYLLGGRLRTTGEERITVVGQDEYEEVKSLFETLSSEHVYSLQKVKHTPSPSTLYCVDSQPVEETANNSKRPGAIRCNESVCRAAEEMSRLRITVAPAPSTSAAPKSIKPASTSSKSPVKEKESPEKPKTEVKAEQDAKDKKKGGLAAMFAAQTSKTSTKTSTSAPKANGQSKKGGISSFFNKVSKEEAMQEKPTTEKKEDTVVSVDSEDDNCVSKPSDAKPQKKEKVDSEPEPQPKNTKKSSSKGTKLSNKRGSKGKEKKDVKKRKRIVQKLESSESEDDIFAEGSGNSSREPSPVPEVSTLQATAFESDEEEVAPAPAQEISKGKCRRKRKVTRDKTFMDDDGYMVTEKVTEYESYSDSETDVTETKKIKQPEAVTSSKASTSTKVSSSSNGESSTTSKKTQKTKAASKKASPLKKSPVKKSPVKSRQQSLTSFFKKKD